MPGVARYHIRLPRDSGVPEDDIVNVLHFQHPGDIESESLGVAVRINTFYSALKAYLSPVLTGQMDIRVYDVEDPPDSGPVNIHPGSFTPTVSTALPSELAICISYVGDGENPIEYRRGRLFFGPLSANSVSQTPDTADIRIAQSVRDEFAATFRLLANGEGVAGVPTMVTYSKTWHKGRGATSGGRPGGAGPRPALDPHPLAEAARVVTSGWVDNAYDIQRRRGAKASARSVFTIP